jgi:hypothetical protein
MPRPGFPKTLAEFQTPFAHEGARRPSLAASRGPDDYGYPRSGHPDASEATAWKGTGHRLARGPAW